MKLVLALFLGLTVAAQSETLGIENHNPGNISADSPKELRYWPGAIGIDPWRHIKFRTSQDGAEALLKNLRLYRSKHHLHTIRQIIGRWVWHGAQKKEREAYIAFVASRLNVNSEMSLDLSDKNTQLQIARAIARYECGQEYYSETWWKHLP
jgi:hypothetical protein